jgi:type IV pilus assembly protein PilN
MRITLNLATRPFADLGPIIKRLRIAMGVLAGLSILFGIGLHLVDHSAEQARARDHSLDGSIASISRERQGFIDLMHQPPNVALLTQAGMLNSLFDEKLFSWTLAMEDLEVVLPGGVQVSSIEPVRAKNGEITLHLRVIGPRDREVELVQNLEHSRRFLSPRIVGENAESSEGQGNRAAVEPVSPSNRFNFDLLAEYNPATLGELTTADRAIAVSKNAAETARARDAALEHTAHPLPPATAPARPIRAPYNGSQRPPLPVPNAPQNRNRGVPQ